jgi:hypothetical protein
MPTRGFDFTVPVPNLVALLVLVSLSTLPVSTRKDRKLGRLNMRIRFEALQQF